MFDSDGPPQFVKVCFSAVTRIMLLAVVQLHIGKKMTKKCLSSQFKKLFYIFHSTYLILTIMFFVTCVYVGIISQQCRLCRYLQCSFVCGIHYIYQ